MGANLSTPEKIAKLCRSGDHASLQALLADLQRNDAAYQSSRAQYLEATDEQGNTPVTLAAARGHLQCVQVLLSAGANVHHVNRKPDGGSALHEAVAHKHEAVVELLLRHRANPFVENCKGYTAMDIACSTRNVPLLRRLEQCAPFAGWLQVKVPQFGGLGSAWQRRWVVVSHRFPSPAAPPASQLTHCVFLAYKNLASTAPACRLWLDGARAREVFNPKAEARLQRWTGGGPRCAQAGVTLHRKHEQPSGVYVTGGHGVGAAGQQEGYTFYLRPDDGSRQSVAALDKLIRTVNNRGFPVDGAFAAAATPSAAAATPTTPAHAANGGTARPQLPPAPAGPLYTHLAGVGGSSMANAPGTWSSYPPLEGGGGSGSVADGTESDEAIARRLQEEYDAEVARQMSQEQEAAGAEGAPASVATPTAPEAPPSAPAVPAAAAGAAAGAAERPDYLTGGFYPRVYHADPPLQPAAQGSGGYPASTPETPGPGVENLQSFGRPSAPALLDLDYPLPQLPLAAGAAALTGSSSGGVVAARPSHLPISTSGRHASAPRLQDDAWLSDVPAAPPSRAASESGAAAASGGGGAAAQPPANPSDDSAVCVFCMDAPATAGVLHGESVHKCLCRECAVHLKESNVQACPMCRETVQAYIMRVF